MILVTGAAGLVGRELIRRLRAVGHPFRGIDRLTIPSSDSSIAADLLDAAACRAACAQVQTIVHTAARQHHSGLPRWGREFFFNANVTMTRNLVDAAISTGVRHIIFISSDMVYGVPRGRAFVEVDEPRPIGPYGRSKLASETCCEKARNHGITVTILRPRLIIGPGRLGILQKLFDRIRLGGVVPILGDGRQRYQMVSVSDVAAACMLALQNPRDAIYNLGSSNPPSVMELLTNICRRAGSSSRVVSLPRHLARAALWSLHAVRLGPLTPEQFRIADVDYVLDTTRAKHELGWRPQFADADMLWSAYDTYVAGLDGQHHAAPAVELQPRPAG